MIGTHRDFATYTGLQDATRLHTRPQEGAHDRINIKQNDVAVGRSPCVEAGVGEKHKPNKRKRL